jgi:hypothetical protein
LYARLRPVIHRLMGCRLVIRKRISTPHIKMRQTLGVCAHGEYWYFCFEHWIDDGVVRLRRCNHLLHEHCLSKPILYRITCLHATLKSLWGWWKTIRPPNRHTSKSDIPQIRHPKSASSKLDYCFGLTLLVRRPFGRRGRHPMLI